MSAQERLYRNLTLGFAVVIAALGCVILVVTLAAGGGPASAGVMLGIVFMALGAVRLYFALRTRR